MELSLAHEASQRTLKQRNLLALICIVLGILVVVMFTAASTRDREVVLQPILPSEMTLSSSSVTPEYLEAVTRDTAQLALNRSPAVHSLADLQDRSLITIRGYTYREQLRALFASNSRAPIVAPNNQAAMQLLLRGRADYLISYGHPMQEAMGDYALHGTRCHKLDEWPLVYVFSRKTPHARQLAEQFDQAFQVYHQPDAAPQPLRGNPQSFATTP